MKDQILAINQVLNEYFKQSPYKVAAKDLMYLFVKNGIFKQDNIDRPGLPIRNLLRKLDQKGELNKIPYIIADRKDKNTKWYFAPTHVSTQLLTAQETTNSDVNTDLKIIDRVLTQGQFASVNSLHKELIPNEPGLYCIKLRKSAILPSKFGKVREDGIIYIGKASISIRKRLWDQELNHNGHATFFRSIGAMLGYLPPKGSLRGKSSRNYKFNPTDTDSIRKWIKQSLLVNYIQVEPTAINKVEISLIRKYKPLVNIQHNPDKSTILQTVRDYCVEIAKN